MAEGPIGCKIGEEKECEIKDDEIFNYRCMHRMNLGVPCEVAEPPPADHFPQKFETIHQKSQLN